MAIQPNNIYAGLQTSFQALVDAVQRGEDTASLQQRQRTIVQLTDTARQLNLLDHERAASLRTIEQLDIQNTIATLSRLLELQRQLNDVVVEDFSRRMDALTISAGRLENTLSRNTALAQENITLLQRQNAELKARLEGCFKISCYALNGRNIYVYIRPDGTTDLLKERIAKEAGMLTSAFTLSFNGVLLSCRHPLSMYQIIQDGTVLMSPILDDD